MLDFSSLTRERIKWPSLHPLVVSYLSTEDTSIPSTWNSKADSCYSLIPDICQSLIPIIHSFVQPIFIFITCDKPGTGVGAGETMWAKEPQPLPWKGLIADWSACAPTLQILLPLALPQPCVKQPHSFLHSSNRLLLSIFLLKAISVLHLQPVWGFWKSTSELCQYLNKNLLIASGMNSKLFSVPCKALPDWVLSAHADLLPQPSLCPWCSALAEVLLVPEMFLQGLQSCNNTLPSLFAWLIPLHPSGQAGKPFLTPHPTLGWMSSCMPIATLISHKVHLLIPDVFYLQNCLFPCLDFEFLEGEEHTHTAEHRNSRAHYMTQQKKRKTNVFTFRSVHKVSLSKGNKLIW